MWSQVYLADSITLLYNHPFSNRHAATYLRSWCKGTIVFFIMIHRISMPNFLWLFNFCCVNISAILCQLI